MWWGVGVRGFDFEMDFVSPAQAHPLVKLAGRRAVVPVQFFPEPVATEKNGQSNPVARASPVLIRLHDAFSDEKLFTFCSIPHPSDAIECEEMRRREVQAERVLVDGLLAQEDYRALRGVAYVERYFPSSAFLGTSPHSRESRYRMHHGAFHES